MEDYNIIRLQNDSGSAVAASTLVYLKDATTRTFDVADATDSTKSIVIGMVKFAGGHNIAGAASIAIGEWADIVISGNTYHATALRDESFLSINWNAGDRIYLSTQGYMTNTPTFPSNTFMENAGIIEVGRCLMTTNHDDAVINLNIRGECRIPIVTDSPCNVLQAIGSMCIFYDGVDRYLCVKVDESMGVPTIRFVELVGDLGCGGA